MRLIDDLAARRTYYHRSLPTLPDILLIDIPPRFSGPGLALGRYYPVIFETLAELTEFEAYLCEQRPTLTQPALLDRRPSALRIDDIVFARYRPQTPDWPWLLLCCWPPAYAAMARSETDAFARGTYTIDAFTSEQEVDAAEARLLTVLGPQEARHVRAAATRIGNA